MAEDDVGRRNETPGPNVKGKVLVEGSPSESYFLERLLRIKITDVDFFGIYSVAEWVISDLVELFEAMANALIARLVTLPALPPDLSKRNATVTLAAVDETSSAVVARPAFGVCF